MNINYFMKEAIKEANNAFNNNEVPIGGILVANKTNEIICRSHNKVNKEKNAIYHCEIDLIIHSCKKLSQKYLDDTVMFVTLEPCLMCASAISKVHIEKLYFGAYDDKNGGIEKFKYQSNRKHQFKTDIYGGIMENDCKNLLENFFKKLR
ncbi:MAG: tRNA-specific adenosine deaminase [Rickettsiales bacterium]|nr:tRNA-specific adenosine deaminase [Rickettsiales bacterium]